MNINRDKDPAQLFNQSLEYFFGIGKDKNMLVARRLMQEASDLGLIKASILLADWYVKGYIPSDNYREAIELYEACCSKGDTQSLCRLGMCYNKGKGVKKDLAKSLEYYVKAYESGVSSACFEIAMAYEKGWGVEKDIERAVQWYSAGVDAGVPECACNLGFCYYQGAGVPRDLDKARELFLEYSDFNPMIQKNLGVIYYKGTDTCPPDEEQAIRWLTEATTNGDPESALCLGQIYRKKKDQEEALRWYSKAARLDKKKGAYEYGFFLYKYGNREEWGNAFKWIKCAAEHKHVASMFMLGLFYKSEIGTPVDHAMALYWFKMAADNGYDQAYSHIGRYYRDGRVVAKNYEIALQWFEKAITSKSDNVRGEALYDYGIMYLDGLGVSKNRDKAIAFLYQAKELDCINAANKLKELDNPVLDKRLLDRRRVLEEGDIIDYVKMKVEDRHEAANWVSGIAQKLEIYVNQIKDIGIAKLMNDGRYMWTLGNIDFAQWMIMVSDRLGLYSVDEKGERSYCSTYFARLFLTKKGKEFKPEDIRHNLHQINNVELIAGEKNYDILADAINAADRDIAVLD